MPTCLQWPESTPLQGNTYVSSSIRGSVTIWESVAALVYNKVMRENMQIIENAQLGQHTVSMRRKEVEGGRMREWQEWRCDGECAAECMACVNMEVVVFLWVHATMVGSCEGPPGYYLVIFRVDPTWLLFWWKQLEEWLTLQPWIWIFSKYRTSPGSHGSGASWSNPSLIWERVCTQLMAHMSWGVWLPFLLSEARHIIYFVCMCTWSITFQIS